MLSLVDGRALVRSRRYVCEIRDYNPIHVQPGVTWLCDMWQRQAVPFRSALRPHHSKDQGRFQEGSRKVTGRRGASAAPQLPSSRMLTVEDVDVPTTVGDPVVRAPVRCVRACPPRPVVRIASVAQLWPSGAGGVAMLCLRTIKITVVALGI